VSLGLEQEIVNKDVYDRNRQRLHDAGITLPRISQLADPVTGLAEIVPGLTSVSPDIADPGNLFRVHWHNATDRTTMAEVPEHIVLDSDLTGVNAKIIVALGNRQFRCSSPPCCMAIDRQLLPWWRCHFQNSGLPQCCCAAGRNER